MPTPIVPTVAAFSPTKGTAAGGTKVTLIGSDLGAITQIAFTQGVGLATNLAVAGDQKSMTCNSPARDPRVADPNSDTTGTIIASYPPTGVISMYGFVYLGTSPVVLSIQPPNGPAAGGNIVSIFGTNLVGASVTFNGNAATGVTVAAGVPGDPDQPDVITCTVPSGVAGTRVSVVVTVGDKADTINYNYVPSAAPPPPRVSSMTPTQGPLAGGTVVTFRGRNLEQIVSVTFAGVSATNLGFSQDGNLTCTTPAGSGMTFPEITTTGGVLDLPFSWTWAAIPVIGAIAPALVAAGAVATFAIAGSGMSAVTAAAMANVAASSISAPDDNHLLVQIAVGVAGIVRRTAVQVVAPEGPNPPEPEAEVVVVPRPVILGMSMSLSIQGNLVSAAEDLTGVASGGQVVFITGQNISVGATPVTFNGFAVVVTPYTQFVPLTRDVPLPAGAVVLGATVPVGAAITNVPIRVTNAISGVTVGGGYQFTYRSGAFSFSGFNYIQVPSRNPLTTSGQVVCAALFFQYTPSFGSEQCLLQSPGNWRLYLDTPNSISFETEGTLVAQLGGGTGVRKIKAQLPIPFLANTWVHVMVSQDGNTGMFMYLNGIQAVTVKTFASYNFLGVLGNFFPDTSGNRMGPFAGGIFPGRLNVGAQRLGDNFVGPMDGLRLYNAVLNADQLAEVYGNGNGCPIAGGASASMVIWYTFDENLNRRPVADSSGNGLDGTATSPNRIFSTILG